MKRICSALLSLLLLLSLALTGCGTTEAPTASPAESQSVQSAVQSEPEADQPPAQDTSSGEQQAEETAEGTVDLSSLPAYAGEAYVSVNDNQPYFSAEERQNTEAFETYSPLDSLGRCGVAWANICPELMPTEERGEIGQVKPSGWHTVKYDCVDGKYLYNRCHLIGFQLAGENANEQNLITGTRYLNIEGMLPFENLVADYVQETGNHVLYRVTPVFDGDNLVAGGVLMEGWSVEDGGQGVCFCVYAYNVQPGVEIDYATGDSWETGEAPAAQPEEETPSEAQPPQGDSTESSGEMEYVLNTNTHKFHYPDCSSVSRMSDTNRQDFVGTREEVIAQGYEPCGNCNP